MTSTGLSGAAPVHPAGQRIPNYSVTRAELSGATPDYSAATATQSGGGHVKADMPNIPNSKCFGGAGRDK